MKVLSVNIEGTKHLEKVRRLIEVEQPELVFLMETPVEQIPRLAGSDYPYTDFLQNDIIGNIRGLSGTTPTGVAVLSKHKITKSYNFSCGLPPITEIKPEGTSHMPAVLVIEVEVRGEQYVLGGVHYTWTTGGVATEEQQEHVRQLIAFGQTLPTHALMGDFNIPRGNESYRLLTAAYKDNIPKEIKTTLDPDLHYANFEVRGRLVFVVDYVLSKPGYLVREVRVVSGVSDHCALVCEIDKS